MTTCYQWFSFPEEFSVVCPRCSRECSSSQLHNTKQTLRYELEALPKLFECHLSCLSCGFNAKKLINWPDDAYWKCDVKGETLWAWSLDHTKVLLDYIKSWQRNDKAYPGYFVALLHLPTHFKLAKNREAAIKSLSQLINKK